MNIQITCLLFASIFLAACGDCNTRSVCTPRTEICDGIDNDCDGVIDNNVVRSCYPFHTGLPGVGICLHGTQFCSAGTFGACTDAVGPSLEVCDGLDNDCEGAVDDSCMTSSIAVPDIQPMYVPGSRCGPEEVGIRIACLTGDPAICAHQVCDSMTNIASNCTIAPCGEPPLL